MKIGVISDTHGYLDPRVFDVFGGMNVIIHAGDICGPSILWELETIAPVYAVLGNCDHALYGPTVGAVATPMIGGKRFRIVHKPKDIGTIDPTVDIVICGHTHQPLFETRGTHLFINPGSASSPRNEHDPTVALLEIKDDSSLEVRIITL